MVACQGFGGLSPGFRAARSIYSAALRAREFGILECARGAGMRAIAVTWGLRPRAELEGARPDHLVDDPSELLASLE